MLTAAARARSDLRNTMSVRSSLSHASGNDGASAANAPSAKRERADGVETPSTDSKRARIFSGMRERKPNPAREIRMQAAAAASTSETADGRKARARVSSPAAGKGRRGKDRAAAPTAATCAAAAAAAASAAAAARIAEPKPSDDDEVSVTDSEASTTDEETDEELGTLPGDAEAVAARKNARGYRTFRYSMRELRKLHESQLTHFVSSPMARRWMVCEWFYPDSDRQFFNTFDFIRALLSVGVVAESCRTRAEWAAARTLLPRPRRTSPAWFRVQRQALQQFRKEHVARPLFSHARVLGTIPSSRRSSARQHSSSSSG